MVLLLLSVAPAWAFEVNMYIFAVTDTGEGVPARLVVDVKPGTGHISIDVGESIVGESTQESVRNAIEAAADIAGENWRNYDYFVRIISPSEKVDGPSAGLPMALAFYAAYNKIDIPDNISGTGQIYPDGSVGPVGGIFEKTKAAHKVGVDTFLIPYGEANTTAEVEEEIAPGIVEKVEKTINIVQYARQKWGMNVYEVKTLEEAVKIVFKGEKPEINVPVEETLPMEKFIPPPASVKNSTAFRRIAENLIDRARDAMIKAEACGSIPETLKSSVDISLDTVRDLIDQAVLLKDKGYYYTAANYAFLAIIDARVYHEVCTHPSVIEPTSMAFQELYDDVKAALESTRKDLEDVEVGRENAEIVAAARERWIRAYLTLKSDVLDVYSLVSADEWVRAANMMLKEANVSEVTPLPDMEELAREWIISAEDILVQRADLPSSVYERVNWAREAYRRRWYLTAAMAAASARGLALGYLTALQGDAYDVLSRELKEPFTPVGVWDELYLNHARYYYEASKYYRTEGKHTQAEDMAKTGVEMYYMARDLRDVLESVKKAPIVRIVEGSNKTELVLPPRTVLLLGAIVALLVGITILLAYGKHTGKEERRIQKKGEDPRLKRYMLRLRDIEKRLKQLEKKKKKTEAERKEIMKLKRLAGRYRKLIEKVRAQ